MAENGTVLRLDRDVKFRATSAKRLKFFIAFFRWTGEMFSGWQRFLIQKKVQCVFLFRFSFRLTRQALLEFFKFLFQQTKQFFKTKILNKSSFTVQVQTMEMPLTGGFAIGWLKE